MMIVTLNFLVIMSITLNFVVKKVDFFPQEKKFLLAVERGDVASTRRLVFSFGLISDLFANSKDLQCVGYIRSVQFKKIDVTFLFDGSCVYFKLVDVLINALNLTCPLDTFAPLVNDLIHIFCLAIIQLLPVSPPDKYTGHDRAIL